jgi:hypothetical protein
MSVCKKCIKGKIYGTNVDGDGIVKDCPDCNGTGSIAEAQGEVVTIEEYVEKLLELYTKCQNENGNISGAKVKEITGGDEGINWGDLHCVEVGTYTCVDIEEVSPEAYHFRQYIYEKLKEKYPHLSFKINTEW